MSDMIAVINEGIIEQVGSSSDIYERPETEFVAGFIGETNLLTGKIVKVNGKDVILECEGEEIRLKLGENLPEGSPLGVSVRPERIIWAAIADDRTNAFQVTVREIIYQGNNIHYRVVTAKGLELGVDITNKGTHKLAAEGDKVQVGWPIEQGIPVRRQTA